MGGGSRDVGEDVLSGTGEPRLFTNGTGAEGRARRAQPVRGRVRAGAPGEVRVTHHRSRVEGPDRGLSAGQIDAAGIWYPLVDTIKQRKPDLVELSSNDDYYPEISFPMAIVTGDHLRDQPDTARKVLSVLQQANDHRAAHPDDAVKVTAEFLKLDVDNVRAQASRLKMLSTTDLATYTRDGTINRWLNRLQDYFVATGKLPAPVDPTKYYAADAFLGALKSP